ncbi:hypothetical protein DEU56DRAFT_962190 [Suillus clintonianus]|uniref:uncharacterized protein n=1 Tax=Suillus clintonianus TaxID=1904413 RepID=UPI001B8842D3|nr:uncharacterized protein DEU56DRAFT_962190 [Suillus clintonianus]KAG2150765.1 hypothetical protein DEU56DRAFT_962190 [Suillus clintonianus]
MYHTNLFTMAKRPKQSAVKQKHTIKIPARPCNMAAAPIDESADNEPLEFSSPESPAPGPSTIGDGDRVGQLSKADWLDEKLLEDGEEELNQLEAEPRPEEDHDSDQSIEFADMESVVSASGPAFTFVNVDSASFSSSHKRKRDSSDLALAAAERSSGPSANKYKDNKFVPQGRLTDEAIDRMLTGKKKKLSAKGKSTKPSVTVSETSEDEESNAPRRFTVYVQVWCETALVEKKSAKGAKVSITIVSCGPFKMDTSRTFQSFKHDIAKVLPCRLTMLPVAKFEWKFENQAQSAPCKKIADEAGYDALLDAVKAKRAAENIVVWLFTPKPAKDEQDWDMGDPDYVERPFNFDEEAGAASRTTKSLIDDMSSKRRKAEAELHSLYPVGRYLLFPDMRVWHDERMNTYFELTEMRVKVWANSIAAGRADTSAPPTTNHFTQKLKVPRPPPDAPISTFGEFYHHRQREQTLASEGAGQEPVPPQPTHGHVIPPCMPPHPHGPYGPPFPGPSHIPGPSHQFFHPSQYMQPPYVSGYPYPLPYYPAVQGHGQPQVIVQPTGEVPSASSSPSLTTSHGISLSEFCANYRISDNDQSKLARLEYQPGNQAVESLDDKEWRDVGQFTKLGRQAFLDAHKKFCKAIKSGTWVK